jgi:hypothetical protein
MTPRQSGTVHDGIGTIKGAPGTIQESFVDTILPLKKKC